MAATQQPPTPSKPATGQSCASCGAPLAPDQRYCLSCGARRGEPRVEPVSASRPGAAPSPSPPGRQSDVSPLAAVIGIALLGGMLLIGVLIGRGVDDQQAPTPIVQVGDATTTTTPATTEATTSPDSSGESGASAAVASEWPAGTDGFTIQLSTVSKDGATTESVEAAKQQAVDDGAADAAVLDSDLYGSLPPGNYVIYSGVHTDRKSAEVAIRRLRKAFPDAAVVEISGGDAAQPGSDAIIPGAGGEQEVPPTEKP